MISKVKALIKLITFYFVDLLITPSKKIKPNSVMVIRLDAIGDFVVFRNFIQVISQNEKYLNSKITLVGNSAWKSLALELDSDFIDEFIWVDRNKFIQDHFYRYNKLKEIVSNGYELLLNPAYSREYLYSETIAKLIYAKEKVASTGDLSLIKPWQKKRSDQYYTRLIATKDEQTFEFTRNKLFFEAFLSQTIAITKPLINLKNKHLNINLPTKYIVVFIGASLPFRKWHIEKFAQMAKHIRQTQQCEIVLCGGPGDIDDALSFERYYQEDFLNLVGKTSLVELLEVIANAALMIANETSGPHFAVALEVEHILVISNGNHYGRFTPYPKDITNNYHVIYPPEIEKHAGDYNKLTEKYGSGSKLNINEIEVKEVINKVNAILQ